MYDIQFLEERDIDQFTGQRGFVWTELEERIVRYGHLVVEDVLGKMFQSHRLAVSDEMHLMPFLGQGFTQFRRYDSTAAERRVT